MSSLPFPIPPAEQKLHMQNGEINNDPFLFASQPFSNLWIVQVDRSDSFNIAKVMNDSTNCHFKHQTDAT